MTFTATKRNLLRILAAIAAAAFLVLTAACGNADASGSSPSSSSTAMSKVDVAVSVNQWESIAKTIGGQDVDLHVILSNDNVNAHEFEPEANDVAQIEAAKVVLVNGVGYDQWATNAARKGSGDIVDAASAGGIKMGANPHVWFSASVRKAAAKAYLAALEKAAPQDEATFEKNYQTWLSGEDKLDSELSAARAELNGKTYAATAPVSHYLMKDLGLTCETPTGFAQAELNQSNPAPEDIQEFQNLIKEKKIDLLVDNVQEANSTTNMIVEQAKKAGIPVVDFTETMPQQYPNLDAWVMALTRNIEAAAKK
ncbi:MAG: zinc ABC transporter substrate-binding protein [Aeriscardovia sp.]|nr:zinc ABC transporter substrate-binding protein [Aeriscardovia sp.]